MTTDNPTDPTVTPDQTAPDSDSAPGLKEGIYLEEKKSTIGTGSTAKTAEYRNFWATGTIGEKSAVMVLLDDQFNLTPIRETFSHEVITGPHWHFIDQGEKKYQHIRPKLDKMLAAPMAHAHPDDHSSAAPTAKPAEAHWWDGGVPTGPPKDPFALDKSAKKKLPSPKKGGWWDK